MGTGEAMFSDPPPEFCKPGEIRISTEEIDAWVRDIQLTIRHLKHPDAPVLPIDTPSNTEMRERLQKLIQVLNTINQRLRHQHSESDLRITITSSCSPLKQEHILEIFSGIIDTIQWEKLENTTHDHKSVPGSNTVVAVDEAGILFKSTLQRRSAAKREFIERLNIPIEFKKRLGYEE